MGTARPGPVPQAPPQRPPAVPQRVPAGAVEAGEMPMLRRRSNFGQFLESSQPGGLGVVLGVGR
eukprot:5196083-Amphidinium_carterae.1